MRFGVHAVRVVAGTLVLAGWMVGCGGGGGGTSNGGGGGGGGGGTGTPVTLPTLNYFPTDANSQWLYASSAASAPSTTTITGTQNVAGQTGSVFQSVDGSDGSVAQDIYVVSGSGVRDYAPAGVDPISQALSGIQVLSFPLLVGSPLSQADVTVDSGLDFDGDNKSDQVRVRATLTVVGLEAVNVTAGSFPAALHVREDIVETVIPSGGQASVDIDLTIDDWYADGVGRVRSVTHVTTPGFDDSTTETLVSYRVGSLKSDYTAPVVQSVTPATGLIRGTSTSVSATFSKPIDPQSIKAGTFTVTDSVNGAVAGMTQLTGNTLSFVAQQAWVSGTYTARITTDVQDLLGNALAADRTWTFVVDATGPGIVSVTPAAGAQDVDVLPSFVIQFSEAPDVGSVTSDSVHISNGFFNLTAVLSVNGNTVTIAPFAQLDFDATYTLSVSGVTDLVGNPMAQAYSQQFHTIKGRFADPVAITGLPGGAGTSVMAIGDVNGDGIADVLLATGGSFDPTNDGLFMLAGHADGTLGTPTKINLGAQLTCSVTSIVIGDVNGDGRADVVVGSTFCGAQVLHQTAGGSLVPAEHLNAAETTVLRIADLDGAGKNALVGVGSTSQVKVWRQDSTGTLVFSQALSILATGFGQDLQIGDVNGDGRADVLVALGRFSGNAGQDIAVFLQQPGGGFAAPAYLSTESPWGATAIALGDLNGDGRQDIVATTNGNAPTYFAVFYQGVGGSLGSATHVTTFDGPQGVSVADVDGDGRADVVVLHPGFSSFSVYLQQSGGGLGPERRYRVPSEGSAPQQLAVGDLNRDGRPDVVSGGSIVLQLATAPTSKGTALAGHSRQAVAAALAKEGLHPQVPNGRR